MNIKEKRLFAWMIDNFIFFIILNSTAIIFDKPIPLFENHFLKTLLALLYFAVFSILYCSKDILIGYNSVGKKIMKIGIYTDDGEMQKNKYILFVRVFLTLITGKWVVYPITILYDGRTYGDEKTKNIIKEI